MTNFVKEIMKIRKDPKQIQFSNWHPTNRSNDKTDIKKWKKGIRDFAKTNGKALIEMVEGLGKEE